MIKRLSKLALGTLILAGCGATPGTNDGEQPANETAAALTSCDVGFAFNGGSWRESAFSGSCAATTNFSFGAASDVPLMVGAHIATFGTTTSGDRAGRFFIDQNDSQSWSSGDTNVRFLAYQAGDKPFAMELTLQHLSGGACVPNSVNGILSPPQSVVGIKRGTQWFIDGNGNGTYDGPGQCDVTGTFGAASDIPTPIGTEIGTVRINGSRLDWFFDKDSSYSWNSPPDQAISNFGTSAMRGFSTDGAQAIGTQNGADVYLDRNANQIYDGNVVDYGLIGYLPSASWTFVGWETLVH